MINPLDLKFKFVEIPTEILLAIWTNNYQCETITCNVKKFDIEGDAVSWGIYKGNSVLSKSLKIFCYEPMPSSRNEDFEKDFRFPSKESAIKFFRENFNDKKVNQTIQDNINKLPIDESTN